MSIRSGESVTKVFTTRGSSGAVNADSLPTGTLYVNGTANGASVTVTNITTGVYKAQVTLPTLAIGDLCDLLIQATVSGVTDNMPIWSDTKDINVDSNGAIPFNNTSIATVTNLTNAPTSGDLTAAMKASVTTAATAATPTAAGVTATVNANIAEVNGTTVDGSGTADDPWGPV
jgi:hypothetical protein